MFKVWLKTKDKLRSILGLRDYGILESCNYGITYIFLRFLALLDSGYKLFYTIVVYYFLT